MYINESELMTPAIPLADVIDAARRTLVGKRSTAEAQEFEHSFYRNCRQLWREVNDGSYRPSRYIVFISTRPVVREIFRFAHTRPRGRHAARATTAAVGRTPAGRRQLLDAQGQGHALRRAPCGADDAARQPELHPRLLGAQAGHMVLLHVHRETAGLPALGRVPDPALHGTRSATGATAAQGHTLRPPGAPLRPQGPTQRLETAAAA